MELDDTVTLPGAEGIDLQLVLAGIGSRGAALLLDLIFQFVAFFGLSLVAGQFPRLAVALLSIGSLLIVFGYEVIGEGFFGGRTLGKLIVGIAVVSDDGTPCTFLAATIRTVMRVVDLLPGVYTVGLASLVLTKRCQRLGDIAAGTLVVRQARKAVVAPMATAALAPVGPGGWAPNPLAIPAAIVTWDTSALSHDEVGVIRTFLVRRFELPPHARFVIGDQLARQFWPKVAGIPFDGGPEFFLERITYARSFR